MVYTISRRFLIPAVTYQTPREERREILANFGNGKYKVIVTSQVLDEGMDVPDASVGLMLGGTGSTREYVQRLGRLLRKKEGKTAKLVEIISKETVEVGISRRRHLKTGETHSCFPVACLWCGRGKARFSPVTLSSPLKILKLQTALSKHTKTMLERRKKFSKPSLLT